MKEKQIAIKMITDNWNVMVSKVNNIVNTYTDDELELPVAPEKNKVKWIIGHLAAVNDLTLSILGVSEVTNPKQANRFTKTPFNKAQNLISIKEIKEYWFKTSELINSGTKKFSANDWFQKHNSITAEEFVKEPHRNKLNVLMGRANHISHHIGQMSLVKAVIKI